MGLIQRQGGRMILSIILNTASAEMTLPEPEPFAFIQVWGTLYDMDQDIQADPAGYGDPEDDTGFKLRRARFGLKAKSEVFQYRISVGVASPFDTVLQHRFLQLPLHYKTRVTPVIPPNHF